MARLAQNLPDFTEVKEVEREAFLTERFSYESGEHVSFLAPTQTGKTTLKFQLLEHVANKKLPAVSLIMKPRDSVVDEWVKKLKLVKTDDWPPPAMKRKFLTPPGWAVWPRHTFDPKVDNKHLREVFRRAILGCYKKGNAILDVDEVYGVAEELRLDDELITVWSRGASMGCGLWGGTQRPSLVPLHMYSQAGHVFVGNTPDKRDRDRLRDISGAGIPPDLIAEVVQDLGEHEWLYIQRKGPRMCIVLAA